MQAETATGLVVAFNVPDGSSPLLRTMNISFDAFARETVQAEATLTDDESAQVQSRSIGQIEVDVTLAAPDDDTTFVSGTLKWTWLPRERLSEDS